MAVDSRFRACKSERTGWDFLYALDAQHDSITTGGKAVDLTQAILEPYRVTGIELELIPHVFSAPDLLHGPEKPPIIVS
jgi:hypothetical protein